MRKRKVTVNLPIGYERMALFDLPYVIRVSCYVFCLSLSNYLIISSIHHFKIET